MAKLNFPTGFTDGQIFLAQNGVSYQWDGDKWTTQLRSSIGIGANPGPNPPDDAVPGMFWWDTVSGQLFILYNDGSSEQWVEASTNHDDLYP